MKKVILILFIFLLKIFAEEKEYLGTLASERAAEKALRYLANTQDYTGSWGKMQYGNNAAICGFAGLAFLSGGHIPDKGKYGDVVTKVLNYIKSCQNETGLICSNPKSGYPMYEHGFATLALCEFYGMTKKLDLKDCIQKAIDLIISCQNKRGGWRYQPRIADDDVTVTSCQVQALRAARDVGIVVPKEVIDKALQYLKSCSSTNGSISYTPGGGGGGFERTGAGVLSIMALGDYTANEVEKGVNFLLKNRWNEKSQHFYYGIYYCTQVMYQKGGEYWKSWFPDLRDVLVANQNEDGSWTSKSYGPVYATALATIVLQIPYGYLPLFER
jgi:prenyltransferase beta subunit